MCTNCYKSSAIKDGKPRGLQLQTSTVVHPTTQSRTQDRRSLYNKHIQYKLEAICDDITPAAATLQVCIAVHPSSNSTCTLLPTTQLLSFTSASPMVTILSCSRDFADPVEKTNTLVHTSAKILATSYMVVQVQNTRCVFTTTFWFVDTHRERGRDKRQTGTLKTTSAFVIAASKYVVVQTLCSLVYHTF